MTCNCGHFKKDHMIWDGLKGICWEITCPCNEFEEKKIVEVAT